RANMHWSWAAVAVGLVVAARPLSTGPGGIACAAMVVAAVRGRRWHREDCLAGADLGARAARSATPLDALATLVRAATGWVRGAGKARDRGGDGGLVLGADERGRRVTVPLGGRGGGAHALIVGATGSG